MKRLAIFGAGGQLGRALAQQLSDEYDVHALTRKDCDIADASAVKQTLDTFQPEIIINAAAYTDVEGAEQEEAGAFAVNTQGARNLALGARETNALLISYSTDYVFDGRKNVPYDEAAPTDPLNVYGRSKLAGEEAITEQGGRYLILRTAWLYSADGKNFFNTVLRLANEHETLRFVSDQSGTPTSAGWLAAITSDLIKKALSLKETDFPSGILHAVPDGEASWYDFAQAIIGGARKRGASFAAKDIHPITSADYPTQAQRPLYSVLANRLLQEKWKIAAPGWQSILAIELDKVYGAPGSDA